VLVNSASSCGSTSGKINVISANTIPEFVPPDHVGETAKSIKGNLRFHSSADPSWIIYTRLSGDIAM